MQTFLPYPDFRKSLACLDNKRLGKQRLEAQQILNTLRDGGGWSNHPAVKMWQGHYYSLVAYRNLAIMEWKRRGFKNTMELLHVPQSMIIQPLWMGDPAFHASHRSNLLRKDPVHYGQFGWKEPHDLPYVWPSKEAAA